MVTGRHVGLDAAELVQRIGEQRLGDGPGIDGLAGEGEARAGNHVGPVSGILLRLRAVARRHVVDQAFVEGPGIHLALPVVDDGVAEAVDLALLVGDARRPPYRARIREVLLSRVGDELVHRALQVARGDQRVLVYGVRQVGVVREHVALRRLSERGCRQRHERHCGQ